MATACLARCVRLGDLKLLIRNTDPGGSVCTTATQESSRCWYPTVSGGERTKGVYTAAAAIRLTVDNW